MLGLVKLVVHDDSVLGAWHDPPIIAGIERVVQLQLWDGYVERKSLAKLCSAEQNNQESER